MPRQRKSSRDAEIEHVRLARAHRHHAVAGDALAASRRPRSDSRPAGSRGRSGRSTETRRPRARSPRPAAGRPAPSAAGARSRAGDGRSRAVRHGLQHLERELEVVPGLALLAGRAQQVGRMVGHDERARSPRSCTRPRRRAERLVRAEQVLRGDAADARMTGRDAARSAAAGTAGSARFLVARDRDCPAGGTSGRWR